MSRKADKEELLMLPIWKKLLLFFGRSVFYYSEDTYGHGMLNRYIAKCSCGTYFVDCMHGDYPPLRIIPILKLIFRRKAKITNKKTVKTVIKTRRRLECSRCGKRKFVKDSYEIR